MASRRITFVILALATLAVWLDGPPSPVQASSTDVVSPAGTVTGGIVIFSPSILLLTPTPATGSLLVPLQLPVAPGAGISFTQLQLVIPGPNPAQNTPVSLAQLLSALVGPASGSKAPPSSGGAPPSLVSVFATSPR
jgi:hypothetical protein